MKIKYIIMIFFIFSTNYIHSQINLDYTQFNNNPFLVNPAFAGLHDLIYVNIHHKQLWNKVNGSPELSCLTVDSKIGKPFELGPSKRNVGIGMIFQQKSNHILKELKGGLTYSWHIINPRNTFSMGVSAEITSSVLNLNDVNLKDHDDPSLIDGESNSTYLNFKAGFNWKNTDRMNIGISLLSLQPNQYYYQSDGSKNTVVSSLKNLAFNFKYLFFAGKTKSLIIDPFNIVLFLSSDFTKYNNFSYLNYQATIELTQKFWVGIGCKPFLKSEFELSSIYATLGIWEWKSIKISYTYEYSLVNNKLINYFGHTNEIHLAWQIGRKYKELEAKIDTLKNPIYISEKKDSLQKNPKMVIQEIFSKKGIQTNLINLSQKKSIIGFEIPNSKLENRMFRIEQEIKICEAFHEIKEQYEDYFFAIEGYLENNELNKADGIDFYEKSYMKAQSIKDSLVRCGMNPETIFAIGLGNELPKIIEKENDIKVVKIGDRIEFYIGTISQIQARVNLYQKYHIGKIKGLPYSLVKF